MTNYREILRLDSLGLNKTQIAEACGCSRTTVIQTLLLAKQNKLGSLNQYIQTFTEICYRRNLIVHNGGKINKKYLNEAKNTKFEFEHMLSSDCDISLYIFDLLVKDKTYSDIDHVFLLIYLTCKRLVKKT